MGRLSQTIAEVRSILRGTESKDVLLNSPDGWVTAAPWMIYTDPTYGTSPKIGDGGTFTSTGLKGAKAPWEQAALSIPGVARATGLIVDPLVSVPWGLYRETDDLPEELTLPSWLSDPMNSARDARLGPGFDVARYTHPEFWAEWVMSALLIGDGLVYAPRLDERGQPLAPLFLLNPDKVELKGGHYWVDDFKINASHIIHLRGPGPYEDGRGVGVLRRHSAALGMTASVRRFAMSTFRSGVPSGYLKTSAPNMTQDAADKLKASWMAAHGGDTRSIAVLNATTDFTPIMWSPVDSDLVNMNKWTLLDIALMFGIEPYMLGVTGDTSTYANVESRIKQNRQTSLVWARRIEAAVGTRLPHGQYLRIQLDQLLRPDTGERYANYASALAAGWMTKDEVRALENMPPLPEEPKPEPEPIPQEEDDDEALPVEEEDTP